MLTGQCLELGEEGLPFAPFAAALRDGASAPTAPAVLEGREREFARLLPELGAAAGHRRRSGAACLFELGRRPVRAARPSEQPLVLVIEDLHWADRPPAT